VADVPLDAGHDKVTRQLLADLAAERFDAVIATFSSEMNHDTARLKADWELNAIRLGALRSVVRAREDEIEALRRVHLTGVFEHGALQLKVVFKPDGKVAGLFFTGIPGRALREAAAREVVEKLGGADFAEVSRRFDAQGQKVVTGESLRRAFDELRGRLDEYRGIGRLSSLFSDGASVVSVECMFEKGTAIVLVALNGQLEITGLHFLPGWTVPDYVQRDRLEEREVVVGTQAWPLRGTLTLPKGKGPFPAVVLVHGSGPGDRDESVGPNRTFEDLAWGLASRGIAALRYEKRVREYQLELPDAAMATVQEETVEDAVAALDWLARQPELDPQRLFVVGHSLGGKAVPLIGQQAKAVRGLVSLAGDTRPLAKLHRDQAQYLASLPGWIPNREAYLKEAEEFARRVEDPGLRDTDLLLGLDGRYWKFLRDYQPTRVAAQLELPMLFLQGERDYQVTMEDFEGWKKALSGRPRATFKSYPKLNHYFLPGEGQPHPKEYQTPGHVPAQVVEDLAKWIADN
jgi:dienelactone hydrolase